MSQCHDEYPKTRAQPGPAVPVEVTQCHDVPEVTEIVVLVAESDRSTMSVIRTALESDLRFRRILAVTSGDEAVLHSGRVDVVVVDLRLASGLGSLGTISQIARRPGHPHIVALSRRPDEWLCQAARCEGADEILDWPDTEENLTERLAHAAKAAPG